MVGSGCGVLGWGVGARGVLGVLACSGEVGWWGHRSRVGLPRSTLAAALLAFLLAHRESA